MNALSWILGACVALGVIVPLIRLANPASSGTEDARSIVSRGMAIFGLLLVIGAIFLLAYLYHSIGAGKPP